MYKEHVRKKPWVLEYTPLPDNCRRTVLSPLHYGDTIEIVLIRGIEGEVTINGKPFLLKSENVLCIPPRQLHTSVFVKGGSCDGDVIAALHITPEALLPYLDLTNLLIADRHPVTSLPTICKNFEHIYDLSLKLIQTESLLDGICILLKIFQSLYEEQTVQHNPLTYNQHIVKIVDWIEANYTNDLTVEKAATQFGYHPHYFCKWIRLHTGTTFNSFLNVVRINHACADLLHGYSCAYAAQRCGYNDPSYFVKVFKRIMGVTPREYIHQNAELTRK